MKMNIIRFSVLLGAVLSLFLLSAMDLTAETQGTAGKTIRIGIVLDGPNRGYW